MGTRVYKYYAVFTYEEEGITITFPDLPGRISCGYSTDEAINMAHDALHLYLDDIKETEIPCSSTETQIVLDSNQKTFLIRVQVGN